MRNSNYARLIQAEKVYQEKIRQLEGIIEAQERQIALYKRLLKRELPEVIEGEVVDLAEESQYGRDTPEAWTMWHDPDGNEYDK